MNYVHISLKVLHIISSTYWLITINILSLIIYPLLENYDFSKSVTSFRQQLNNILWHGYNISFALIVISGTGMLGVNQRNVYDPNYSILFFFKITCIIIIFILSKPYFVIRNKSSEAIPKVIGNQLEIVLVRASKNRALLILCLSLLIVVTSFINNKPL